MMISRKTLFAASLLAAGTMAQAAHAAPQCEVDRPLVFAGLGWDSNTFHVEVAKFILKNGYGCDGEMMPGETIPMINGMARGDIDIIMETWLDNAKEAWEKQKKRGKVEIVGIAFPDATQGWFVPRYLVEGENAKAPGLKSVSDLPKYKDLFKDPEEPGKGRFYNCIAGWGCEPINTKKLSVYKLTDDFTNFRPGTGAALSSAIASAYKRKKPIVYYYWGPTWVMGKYDGVMLKEPAYDDKLWHQMMDEKNPTVATEFPAMKVYISMNTKLAKKTPKLKEFLSKYHTTSAMVSKALVYLQDNKGSTAKDAAVDFLKTREDVWTEWVSPEVATSVKAALK